MVNSKQTQTYPLDTCSPVVSDQDWGSWCRLLQIPNIRKEHIRAEICGWHDCVEASWESHSV